MIIMEFLCHPGPPPFSCHRSIKWQTRVSVGTLVEIRGTNPAVMPPTPAMVTSIEREGDGVRMVLDRAPLGWRKVGHPIHGDWAFFPPDMPEIEKV